MGEFRRLQSALILFQHNITMLHWTVLGLDFDMVHPLMGDYYSQISMFLDEVTEISIQLGEMPVTLQSALKILDDDSGSYYSCSEGDTFTSKDCFEKIHLMFTVLINLYGQLISSPQLPQSISNKLQEHDYWLRKECNYKNKRRLS